MFLRLSPFQRRKLRTRRSLKAVAQKDALRICIFRSNKHFYVQLIDDRASRTLVSCSTLDADVVSSLANLSFKEKAGVVGSVFATRVVSLSLGRSLYLDRGGYLYHGAVKVFADSARVSGLLF